MKLTNAHKRFLVGILFTAIGFYVESLDILFGAGIALQVTYLFPDTTEV